MINKTAYLCMKPDTVIGVRFLRLAEAPACVQAGRSIFVEMALIKGYNQRCSRTNGHKFVR